MNLLLFIVLGGLAGWLASIIMKTDASQGILLNIVVGVTGAFFGGVLFNLLGAKGVTGFNLWSLLVALVEPWCCSRSCGRYEGDQRRVTSRPARVAARPAGGRLVP